MYLGTHMEYEVETSLGELFVVRPETTSPLAKGAAVSVSFDPVGVKLVRR